MMSHQRRMMVPQSTRKSAGVEGEPKFLDNSEKKSELTETPCACPVGGSEWSTASAQPNPALASLMHRSISFRCIPTQWQAVWPSYDMALPRCGGQKDGTCSTTEQDSKNFKTSSMFATLCHSGEMLKLRLKVQSPRCVWLQRCAARFRPPDATHSLPYFAGLD